MNQEILLVKIQNAISEGKDYYESTRGNWKVDKKRLKHIQYVVGVNKGKVECVFKPSSWEVIISEIPKENNRKRFEGIEESGPFMSRLQKCENLLLKKFGSGASVGYAFLSEIES